MMESKKTEVVQSIDTAQVAQYVLNIDWTKLLPIVIACLALIIAFRTLYLNKLKPAEIRIFPGEKFKFCFSIDNSSACILQIIIPSVIDNAGSQMGVLHKAALLINDPIKYETYFCEWAFFMKYDLNSNSLQNEAMASPLSLQGGASMSKFIKFDTGQACRNWSPTATKYGFKLIGWTRPQHEPDICYDFSIKFTDENVRLFTANKENRCCDEITVTREGLGRWETKTLSQPEVLKMIGIAKNCKNC